MVDWQYIGKLVQDWQIEPKFIMDQEIGAGLVDQSRIGNGNVLDWQRIGAQVVQGLQLIN